VYDSTRQCISHQYDKTTKTAFFVTRNAIAVDTPFSRSSLHPMHSNAGRMCVYSIYNKYLGTLANACQTAYIWPLQWDNTVPEQWRLVWSVACKRRGVGPLFYKIKRPSEMYVANMQISPFTFRYTKVLLKDVPYSITRTTGRKLVYIKYEENKALFCIASPGNTDTPHCITLQKVSNSTQKNGPVIIEELRGARFAIIVGSTLTIINMVTRACIAKLKQAHNTVALSALDDGGFMRISSDGNLHFYEGETFFYSQKTFAKGPIKHAVFME
jgi:hypothetical protein